MILAMRDLQKIVDWLYRQDCRPGSTKWEDLLANAAVQALGKSRIDAERFAAGGSAKTYWNRVLQLVEEDRDKGRNPLIIIHNPKARILGWYADTAGVADTKEIRRRNCLQCRSIILRKIDALTDREYEALGCVVSEQLGADNVLLTPRGNEGGIDFFASFHYRSDCHVFHGRGGRLRVVGQSKKYAERVKREKIDLLDKVIEKVRNRNPEIAKVVPPWFYQATGPIVGWVIGHSGFQEGAESTARNIGMLLSDSADLAEAFALSRGVGKLGIANCAANLQSLVAEVIARVR